MARLPGHALPVPGAGSGDQGRKYRTTWTDYAPLEAVHQYAGLDRAAAADGSGWRTPQRWGKALLVTGPGLMAR